MNYKFFYEEPIIEIIQLACENVITTSEGVWDGGEGDTEEDIPYPTSF